MWTLEHREQQFHNLTLRIMSIVVIISYLILFLLLSLVMLNAICAECHYTECRGAMVRA